MSISDKDMEEFRKAENDKRVPTEADEKIWNQPVPDRKYLCSFNSPKNRRGWASDIYAVLFLIQSGCDLDLEKELEILEDVVVYCKTYNMPSIAWFAQRLAGCMASDSDCEFKDELHEYHSKTTQFDSLRGIFHDESEHIVAKTDSWFTREDIEESYQLHLSNP
jgi:hypothetical protein